MPKRVPTNGCQFLRACLPQFTVITFTMLGASCKTPAAGGPSAEPIVE